MRWITHVICTFLCVICTPTRADALLCNALLGCSCTVSASDLDFDAFNPLSGAQSAEGEINVDCTGVIDVAPSVAVRLTAGSWGTIANRKLHAASGEVLSYNIYTASNHGIVWGDGVSGSTVTVSGGALQLGHWHATRIMYGLVTPAVTTKPGNYTDQVVVRIDW